MPARHSARSAAAYARSIRSQYATRTYGTGRRRRRRRRDRGRRSSARPRAAPGRPRRAARRRRRPTARLIRRAPCEPPNTSSVGRSGSSPKDCARLGRARPHGPASGSSGAAASRCRPGVRAASCPATRDGDVRRPAGTEPVRQPRAGVRLVHDVRHVPTPRRQVRRSRRIAAEADEDVGVGALQHALGRPDGGPQPTRAATPGRRRAGAAPGRRGPARARSRGPGPAWSRGRARCRGR